MEIRSRGLERGSNFPSGLYSLKSADGKRINSLCDMTSFNGGWTLLLNKVTGLGWTPDSLLSRNTNKASKSQDYSILSHSATILGLKKEQVCQRLFSGNCSMSYNQLAIHLASLSQEFDCEINLRDKNVPRDGRQALMKHSTSSKCAFHNNQAFAPLSFCWVPLGSITLVPDVLLTSCQPVAVLFTRSHDSLELSCQSTSLPVGRRVGRRGVSA